MSLRLTLKSHIYNGDRRFSRTIGTGSTAFAPLFNGFPRAAIIHINR